MPGWLRKILGQDRAEIRDARRIYQALMTQSRKAEFFGKDKVPDSYDGRIELLTLHMAIVMHRLKAFDEQGRRLSQALYDVMIEDFDIALREESLADTAVSRRIKPMAQLFFTRAKAYSDALDANKNLEAIKAAIIAGPITEAKSSFASRLAKYIAGWNSSLEDQSLGDIALAKFNFSKL